MVSSASGGQFFTSRIKLSSVIFKHRWIIQISRLYRAGKDPAIPLRNELLSQQSASDDNHACVNPASLNNGLKAL
jgi:hypothetical protein